MFLYFKYFPPIDTNTFDTFVLQRKQHFNIVSPMLYYPGGAPGSIKKYLTCSIFNINQRPSNTACLKSKHFKRPSDNDIFNVESAQVVIFQKSHEMDF